MSLFYIDASAWVKRHQLESGSDWIARLWRPNIRFASANLGLIEVLCTIARRHAANRIDQTLTDVVLLAVRRDFDAFVRIDLDDAVLRLAERLAAQHRLRGADCVHLASAIRLRELAGVVVSFIAADNELLTAAGTEGFPVLNPTLNPPLPAQ